VSIAELVRADIQRQRRTKCLTCRALLTLSDEDYAEVKEMLADPDVPNASIARAALKVTPGNLTDHLQAGHEPR